MAATGSLAERFQRETSISVITSWIEATLAARRSLAPQLSENQYLYGCFLTSDMNAIGAGCFPSNLKVKTQLNNNDGPQCQQLVGNIHLSLW